jgi:hypothetical protein
VLPVKKRSRPSAKGGRARRRRPVAAAPPVRASVQPLWGWSPEEAAEGLASYFRDAGPPAVAAPTAAGDAVHVVSPIAAHADTLPEHLAGCIIRSTLRPGDRMSIAPPEDGPVALPLLEGERVVGFDVRGAAAAEAYTALLDSVEVIIPKADALPGRRVLRWQLLDDAGRTLATGEASFDLAPAPGELELELGIIHRRFVVGDYGALAMEQSPFLLS